MTHPRHQGSLFPASTVFLLAVSEDILFIRELFLSSSQAAKSDRWHVNALGSSMSNAF